jgi:hypothetical protein
VNVRRTIGTSFQHGVFQELRDNLFPRLKHEFVLVRVPLALAMCLKGRFNILVDSLNALGDIVLGFFGATSAFRLEKLQLIDFHCWDQQSAFKKTEFSSKLRDLKGEMLSHAMFVL